MKKLEPLNSVIQICPICSKVDAYEGDNHDCDYYIKRDIDNDKAR